MRLFPQDGGRKKTTKYGKHRKKTVCEEKPQNTQNTQKKHCMWRETTEHTEHTEKGLHVERKPQNTPNTPKSATRRTACGEGQSEEI